MRRDYVGLASIFLRLAMAPDTILESSAKRLCQGVSPNDEPCGYPATVHCPICKRWFCNAHAEEEDWHSCEREPQDEGGEA